MNTKTQEQLSFMEDFKKKITDYLKGQLEINVNALKSYEDPIKDSDTEIRRMREIEAIKIRHSIYEINSHIAVIEKM